MSEDIASTRPRTLSRTPVRLHGAACVQAVPEPAGAANRSAAAGAAAAGIGAARPTVAATAAATTCFMPGQEGARIGTPHKRKGTPDDRADGYRSTGRFSDTHRHE
jgi:hypothetical protein